MKRIGHATTEDERALEAAIAGVPHWPLAGVSYCPVYGGITNSNWRVSIGERHYFVKIPAVARKCSSTGPWDWTRARRRIVSA